MVHNNNSIPRYLVLQVMKYRCDIKPLNYATDIFLDNSNDF